MQYRQLGSSDLKISAVTFGAWAIGGWMWGGADEADAVAAIQAGIDAGVTSIDTAPMYGYGRSEEIVGKAITGRRDALQILTKYCLRWNAKEGEFLFSPDDPRFGKTDVYRNARPESIMYECEQSLRRLGIDCIDLYQCHWRDGTTPLEVTMEAMDKLVQQGKIRAAGVSNFTVEEIAACKAVFPLASDQPPFSMVHRQVEADVLPYCRENNIGVIVYSPLQRGLLTGKITPGYRFNPGDHRADSPLFKGENLRKVNTFLDKIRPVADGHRATLAQLVIAWTIRQPGITAALVGARNPSQVTENAAAADLKITDEEMSTINSLLDELKLDA